MKLRLAALDSPSCCSAPAAHRRARRRDAGGVYAVRSTCPIAGVPAGTGDITLFDPAGSTDSTAIDVTAAISDVRATCQDAGNDSVSVITFTITALRRDAGPARQVALPYFNIALRGGGTVSAKTVAPGCASTSRPAALRSWTRRPGGRPRQSRRGLAPGQCPRDPDSAAQVRRKPKRRSIRWPSPASAPRSPTRRSSI